MAKAKQFYGNALVYENGGTAGNLKTMLSNTDSELKHPFSSRIRWAEEAIGAIAHIHQLGLIHGEITPTNIIFDKTADTHVHLKIANMTSARFDPDYLNEVNGLAVLDDSHDPDGVRWLSPDGIGHEAHGELFHKRKDIWQLGILIAELMLLKPPYATCKYTINVMKALDKQPPFTQEELEHTVGPKFTNFILQCCEKNPEKRPTMDKIVNELWPDVLLELKEKIKSCETPTHHDGELGSKAPISRLGL